jgi:Large eukaryotic DNA virus major capsid protein/Major capsid protein N-terminus
MNCWYELSRKFGQDRGYAKMIGNTQELTQLSQSHKSATLYIPLYFFHCRNDGLALPLIALQYHDVRYEFEFRKLEECVITSNCNVSSLQLRMEAASLFVDYVYLESEERKKFAQNAHEYLIEQIQFTGEESVSINSNKFRLNFNHPCKALYWNLKLGRYTNPSGAYKFLAYDAADTNNLRLQATKRFVLALAAYTTDTALSQVLDTSNNRLKLLSTVVTTSDLGKKFLAASAVGITTDADVDNITILGELLSLDDASKPVSQLLFGVTGRVAFGQGSELYDVVVRQYDNYGVYMNGTENPVQKGLLQLNGHDRFSERDGNYFNYVQPCMYSFSLNPEDHQPSGTCNMSRIDNATLNITFGVDGVSDFKSQFLADDSKISIYALNYNVLRILSGMGGLASMTQFDWAQKLLAIVIGLLQWKNDMTPTCYSHVVCS